MLRTDSLGQTNPLTGFQAYCSVNNNNAAAGQALVAAAPLLQTPGPCSSLTVTLTSAAFSIAYLPTPFTAGQQGFFYCSMQVSAGRTFNGDLRLIAVSTAAQASPEVLLTAYTARFGVPVTGNRVFIKERTYYLGFLSGPLILSQVIQ